MWPQPTTPLLWIHEVECATRGRLDEGDKDHVMIMAKSDDNSQPDSFGASFGSFEEASDDESITNFGEVFGGCSLVVKPMSDLMMSGLETDSSHTSIDPETFESSLADLYDESDFEVERGELANDAAQPDGVNQSSRTSLHRERPRNVGRIIDHRRGHRARHRKGLAVEKPVQMNAGAIAPSPSDAGSGCNGKIRENHSARRVGNSSQDRDEEKKPEDKKRRTINRSRTRVVSRKDHTKETADTSSHKNPSVKVGRHTLNNSLHSGSRSSLESFFEKSQSSISSIKSKNSFTNSFPLLGQDVEVDVDVLSLEVLFDEGGEIAKAAGNANDRAGVKGKDAPGSPSVHRTNRHNRPRRKSASGGMPSDSKQSLWDDFRKNSSLVDAFLIEKKKVHSSHSTAKHVPCTRGSSQHDPTRKTNTPLGSTDHGRYFM
jgi:hypothetical protein